MASRRFLKVTNDSANTVLIGGAPGVGDIGIASSTYKIIDLDAMSLEDLQGLDARIADGSVSVAAPSAAEYVTEGLSNLDEHIDSAVS